MNDNPHLDLVFPILDNPLQDSSLPPFDWKQWMDEIEEYRKVWVKSYGGHQDNPLSPQSERFELS